MNRLTMKDGDGSYSVNSIPDAIERLAMYEDLYEEILSQYERLTAQLAAKRSEGREKTARFREDLGNKLLYSQMISMFKQYKLG